ncbi:glycosyltransferase family 8 [Chlorella sorokiniana]|uniref:Hexosyltransferase n=1 Tax=Chlorella sorokiniana TaxID=3076 RepID=A0A2P6TUI0_CHLSO|nr:glycosyltransferase family 8 [Chlorella sorokiniana]|eukprot:PRW57725.1 glycosyltransferase family 8 [Chlorella sorokiniana]
MMGRSEAAHPAPRCCRDEACAFTGAPGQRAAVVTYLRDDTYLPLLQQLECTLRRSNPELELALMHVPGEVSDAGIALARALNLTLLPVEPLEFRNTYETRYGRNWLKVRALGLTQYHSVLLMDSDVAVVGDLAPLFALPTDFAAVWDQSKWLNRFRTVQQRINGGVFLLRPCAAVEAHMLQLVESHPKLRFVHGTAEQDFFGWYYRYTGTTLPMHWNCQATQCLDGNLTVGGAVPRIVHYTSQKPMKGPQPGEEGHQFLCSLRELEARAGGVAPASSSSSRSGGARRKLP